MEHGWFMALKMRNLILNILIKKIGPVKSRDGKRLKWVFVTLEKCSGQTLSSFLKIAFFDELHPIRY